LNKGTTKDSFQMAGKTPTDSGKLKTNVKGTLTTEENRHIMIVVRSWQVSSNHPARIRFEKTQQINAGKKLQCFVSLGHNRYPKTRSMSAYLKNPRGLLQN
jgi:hypothetical protein